MPPSFPTAKVIADSISPHGERLTTVEARCHRMILAELNTHRKFSRNSASSRAIPFKKQLERVLTDPAIPISFPAEQAGMRGGEELDEVKLAQAKLTWLDARDMAVRNAQNLADLGVHKSVVNRLLEPFMWHQVIISSTEWENFFRQRCSPLAQPEMEALANAIYLAMVASKPVRVEYGHWHMPYLTQPDIDQCVGRGIDPRFVSVARCARVSYLTHDGERDPEKDLDLYSKLVGAEPPHASPLEHVATPEFNSQAVLGNFDGWSQLRHAVIT